MMKTDISPESLAALIKQHIPDAEVNVSLYSGDDHFSMQVIAEAFQGKSRVMRQRLVYRALGSLMDERIHALQLTTLTPAEAE